MNRRFRFIAIILCLGIGGAFLTTPADAAPKDNKSSKAAKKAAEAAKKAKKEAEKKAKEAAKKAAEKAKKEAEKAKKAAEKAKKEAEKKAKEAAKKAKEAAEKAKKEAEKKAKEAEKKKKEAEKKAKEAAEKAKKEAEKKAKEAAEKAKKEAEKKKKEEEEKKKKEEEEKKKENEDAGGISNRPTSSERLSFTEMEIAIFNRREWQQTQEFLPNSSGKMVPNATYEPGYVPRYYVVDSGDPAPIFVDDSGYWDPSINSFVGKEHPSTWQNTALVTPGAGTSTSSLNPGGWLSPETLKGILIDERGKRASGALKIDGLLYSNNSIFTMTRRKENSAGKLEINGGVVSSDVGMLSAGGLHLRYDDRVSGGGGVIKVKSSKEVKMRPKLFPAKVTLE